MWGVRHNSNGDSDTHLETYANRATPRHCHTPSLGTRNDLSNASCVVLFEDHTHILFTNTKSASSTHESRCRKAYISTAGSVIHLEELAQHEGVVVGVANFPRQPLLHVGQHVRQPLAAAHQQMH